MVGLAMSERDINAAVDILDGVLTKQADQLEGEEKIIAHQCIAAGGILLRQLLLDIHNIAESAVHTAKQI
jgi:hypothetical protein